MLGAVAGLLLAADFNWAGGVLAVGGWFVLRGGGLSQGAGRRWARLGVEVAPAGCPGDVGHSRARSHDCFPDATVAGHQGLRERLGIQRRAGASGRSLITHARFQLFTGRFLSPPVRHQNIAGRSALLPAPSRTIAGRFPLLPARSRTITGRSPGATAGFSMRLGGFRMTPGPNAEPLGPVPKHRGSRSDDSGPAAYHTGPSAKDNGCNC